jgi:hypothetical protein
MHRRDLRIYTLRYVRTQRRPAPASTFPMRYQRQRIVSVSLSHACNNTRIYILLVPHFS